MNTELNKPISFRPSAFDVAILEQIQEENPYIASAGDLLRLALYIYKVRQAEIKVRQSEIEELKERIAKLESTQK